MKNKIEEDFIDFDEQITSHLMNLKEFSDENPIYNREVLREI